MKLFARSQLFGLLLLFTVCAGLLALTACAQLGAPTPQTFNERLAAGYGTVTQVRSTATALLTAKAISVDDAANVLRTTDTAREGLELARSIAATDAAGASTRLQTSVAVLTALQQYLLSKQPGASPSPPPTQLQGAAR